MELSFRSSPLCFEQNYDATHCLVAPPCRCLNTRSLSYLSSKRKWNWRSWIRIIRSRGIAISEDIFMDLSKSFDRDIPYSPSFILDLPAQVDQNLRNIIDFVFLPGFNNPTLAMLFQTQQTWTGSVSLV